jgi:pimeloyl-ACP methyl ester carboxylesterase
MATALFNGVNLYHEEAGSGQPLVMVHGSWTDHHSWDLVVPPLAERFRVVTYDRRGHSQSERPAGQGSVLEDVADLAALIEGLGLTPAHVIGNSFGASIVLRLAGERPELFRSLVAHEPPLFGLLGADPTAASLLSEVSGRIGAVVGLLATGDMEGGARQFTDTIAIGPGAWDEQLPPEAKQTFINNAPTWLDETRDPEALTLDPARLARFSQPALLSNGSDSPPLFPPVVTRVVKAIPGARRHIFEGAGHIPHQTQPAQFVDAVSAFIQTAA